MSTEENAVKEPTDAEQVILLRGQIEEAETRLRQLRDKERGITRMQRSAFDKLSAAQCEALSSSIVAGKLILED
jgi:hypothetical protein